MGEESFPGGGPGSRRAASVTRIEHAMWYFLSYLTMGRAFHGILGGSYGLMIPSINSGRAIWFLFVFFASARRNRSWE